MRLHWGAGAGRTQGGFGARTKNWIRDEVGTDGPEERQGRASVRAGSELQLHVGWGVPGAPDAPAKGPGSPCPAMGAAASPRPLFSPASLWAAWPHRREGEASVPARRLQVGPRWVATLPAVGLEAGGPLLSGSPPASPPLVFHSLIWPLMDLTQLLL